MLYPLFDKDCDLVAWITPNAHIFDTDMNWIAYIQNGNAWSSESGNWLGPVNGLLCLNQAGQPIAWNPKEPVKGTSRPSRPSRASRPSRPSHPSRPSSPSRPSRPSTPSGGWASESFLTWFSQ